MMTRRTVRNLVGVGLLAISAAGAGGAWACFPLPVVSVQPRASAPPGTQVNLEGVDFTSGKIEVRWNGLTGPLLGQSTGPNFSVPVTIPDAPGGSYTMVVFVREKDDTIGVKLSVPFDVTSPDSPSTGSTAPARATSGSGLSSAQTAALALGGLVLLVGGGAGGAVVSRRRRPRRDAAPAVDS